MKYMGSKARVAKEILPFIKQYRKGGQAYFEPFVGGCNLIDKVGGERGASDINPYLITMWEGLSKGWQPPKEISRDLYNSCRDIYNQQGFDVTSIPREKQALIGYVGFNGSYGGRFYDGGYAGVTTTKQGKVRNYPVEAYNNVIKQVVGIKEVDFLCGDYKDVNFVKPELIYCDPPYAGTKEYKAAQHSGFSSESFWSWCAEKVLQGHTVLVSEYNAPTDWVCVWEKQVSSSLRANGVISGDKKSVERLFVHKTQYKDEVKEAA